MITSTPDAVELTPREKALLQHLAAGRGYKDIGPRQHRSSRTIEADVLLLRRKLGAANNAHLVHLAWQQGFLEKNQNTEQ